MQRYILSVVIGGSLILAAAPARAQTCPVADVQAAIDQACPCGGFRNHGQYMKCVRKQVGQLAQAGCDVSERIRCAASSVCGRPHSPVVCCNRRGRAKVFTAEKCLAGQGTVMTGLVRPCDAVCPTPAGP